MHAHLTAFLHPGRNTWCTLNILYSLSAHIKWTVVVNLLTDAVLVTRSDCTIICLKDCLLHSLFLLLVIWKPQPSSSNVEMKTQPHLSSFHTYTTGMWHKTKEKLRSEPTTHFFFKKHKTGVCCTYCLLYIYTICQIYIVPRSCRDQLLIQPESFQSQYNKSKNDPLS